MTLARMVSDWRVHVGIFSQHNRVISLPALEGPTIPTVRWWARGRLSLSLTHTHSFTTIHSYFPWAVRIASCSAVPSRMSNFFARGGPKLFPSHTSSPFSVKLKLCRRGLVSLAFTFKFGKQPCTPEISCLARLLYVDQETQCSKIRSPVTFVSFAPVTISGSKDGRAFFFFPELFFVVLGIVVAEFEKRRNDDGVKCPSENAAGMVVVEVFGINRTKNTAFIRTKYKWTQP